MSKATKFLTFMLIAIAALGGIYLLEPLKAVLWVFFLIVSYPVLSAFLSSLLDGTRFSPEELNTIYTRSLKSIPFLGRFVEAVVNDGEERLAIRFRVIIWHFLVFRSRSTSARRLWYLFA